MSKRRLRTAVCKSVATLRPAERVLFNWIDHPAWDYVIGAAVGIAVTGVSAWQHWGQVIASADAVVRRTIIQIVATFSGTLLGLTLTSLSILVGMIRTPVRELDVLLPGARKLRMVRTFISGLFGLGVVFLVSVWAILNNTKDNTSGSNVVQLLILSAICLAALRISRVVLVLWKMLEVTTHGTSD